MVRVGWQQRIAALLPPENRTCAYRRVTTKPLQRHLSTPGSTTSFSGILRISTAIEMVHLEVAGCTRPAISLLHNMRNIPAGVHCDGLLTVRTQAILP